MKRDVSDDQLTKGIRYKNNSCRFAINVNGGGGGEGAESTESVDLT